MTKITYQIASDDHYQFCEGLHHESMRVYVEPLWGWDEEFQHQRYKKIWKPENIKIINFEKTDIGYLETEDYGDYIKIVNFFIAKEFRDKGIGTLVLGDLTKDNKKTVKKIKLNVLNNNPAKKLYEKIGFQFISEDKGLLSYEMDLH